MIAALDGLKPRHWQTRLREDGVLVLAFDRAVNITLGLPIVRTSVDHGTAFGIAWQGKASPNSLFEAIRWAARLSVPRGAERAATS